MQEALHLFDELTAAKPIADVSTYNILLASITRMDKKDPSSNFSTIFSLLNKLNRAGATPDTNTCAIFVDFCGRSNNTDLGFAVFVCMLRRGWGATIIFLNYLHGGLCVEKSFSGAAQLLDKMPQLSFMPNVVSCSTTVIKGHCESGNTNFAIYVLRRMNTKSDVVTFTTVINARCRQGKTVTLLSCSRRWSAWESNRMSLHTIALLSAVITGLVNFVATFVSIALVDRAGRRFLFITGGVKCLFVK